MATPLFGGALSVELHGHWLDASDVRPVPDHQEVWTERDGPRALVIELLQRVDAHDDRAVCAHFEELSERNGALHAKLSPQVSTMGRLDQSLRAAEPAYGVHGVQTLPDGVDLHVHLRLVRLLPQETDVLLSLCRPWPRGDAGAASCEVRSEEGVVAEDAAAVDALVRSVRVHDWHLFGETT
ncbi:hypothetical protein AB1Y20_003608 [Prymnesium parvum]|uniref:Uncharacterized protein n=1 Tax=Prymnesium parvum TaxID=97485 RepID=A0AB34J7E6_PRYPA